MDTILLITIFCLPAFTFICTLLVDMYNKYWRNTYSRFLGDAPEGFRYNFPGYARWRNTFVVLMYMSLVLVSILSGYMMFK